MELTSWLKKKADNESCFGLFIKFMYRFFVNPVIQCLINFVASIIAPFLFFNGQVVNWKQIYIFSMIYIPILCLMAFANNYRKNKSVQINLLNQCLKECSTITFHLKEKILETNIKLESNKQVKHILEETDIFKTAATGVCDSIYNQICDYSGCKKCKVTVFQQYVNDNEKYIKMVAHKSHVNESPSIFRRKIELFERNTSEDKKLKITKIFESNKQDTIMLDKYKKVKEEFIEINSNTINTHQYIAVPGVVNDSEIGFVIQICAYEEKQLGNKDKINDLVQNILLPYREILKFAYEQNRLFDILYHNR